MIRNLHLTILFLFVFFSLQGQISINPLKVEAEGNADDEFVATAVIQNNSAEDIDLRIEKLSDNLRDNWYTVFQVNEEVHSHLVSSLDLTIKAGESQEIGIVFYPEGSQGSSSVDVLIRSLNPDGGINLKQTFVGKTIDPRFAGQDDFNIFPNPATRFFKISDNDLINRVEVYNIIGKKLVEYPSLSKNQEYDVGELSRGIYLVRLLDEHEKVVATKRLNIVIP